MAEEYNPDIVSVVDENGEEHIFEELDRIETDDARYVALLPVYDDAEDILEDDGEIILLKVEEEANVGGVLATLRLIGEDKKALLMLDKDLATSTFVAPVIG